MMHEDFFTQRVNEIRPRLERAAHGMYGHDQHRIDDLVSHSFERLWNFYTTRPDLDLANKGIIYWLVCGKWGLRSGDSREHGRSRFHADCEVNDEITPTPTQVNEIHQAEERIDILAAAAAAAEMVSDTDRPRMLKLMALLAEGYDIKEAAPIIDITYDQAIKLMRNVVRPTMRAALNSEPIPERKRKAHGQAWLEAGGNRGAQCRALPERARVAAQLHAQGRKYQDIADHLGCHYQTAMRLVQRGHANEEF